TGKVISWKKNPSGEDDVYEDYSLALEAIENDGWWGYVLEYPTGIHPYWKDKLLGNYERAT
ncbi:MAG: hypothetical protein EB127_23450, partial [Alphaproteobacteria bacterium]|nr:hypothetical protein [Alphaproteobacteria bacterium]